MLSVVDGRLAPVSWEDLDPDLVQDIQCESSGYPLHVLKDGHELEKQWILLMRETSTLCRTLLPPAPPAMYRSLM